MNLLILDDEIYTVRALQKSVDWKAAGIDTVEIAFNTEKQERSYLRTRSMCCLPILRCQESPGWNFWSG